MKLWDGSTFEHKGFHFRVKFKHDDDLDPPWERSDGHGPVREVPRDHYAGPKPRKKPGERFLNDPYDSRITLYTYDWKEACRLARKDGWNTEPYDAPNRIERAVQADFDFIAGWLNDSWSYVFVDVTLMEEDEDGELVEYTGGEFDPRDSLGGVETFKDYHCIVALECADNIIAAYESALSDDLWDELAAAREALEARYWAERDSVTR